MQGRCEPIIFSGKKKLKNRRPDYTYIILTWKERLSAFLTQIVKVFPVLPVLLAPLIKVVLTVQWRPYKTYREKEAENLEKILC